MKRSDVPVENVAEIIWGALLLIYLAGAGRPEFLQPQVLVVFALSGSAALVELYLRRTGRRWLTLYDSLVWTALLSVMVLVTGGRGSELWAGGATTAPSTPGLRGAPQRRPGPDRHERARRQVRRCGRSDQPPGAGHHRRRPAAGAPGMLTGHR